MQVTAFPDRFVRGFPKSDDDERAIVAPAGDILSSRYATDAHFAAYASDFPRRHTISLFKNPDYALLIPEVGLRMSLAVFDVDAPDHVISDVWWQNERAKIATLLTEFPDGFVYRTRGGYRVVYELAAPYALSSQADDDTWSAQYWAWLRLLKRRFDIDADEACTDWTRLYRLPFVTRDGKAQELETIGDPNSLGPWNPKVAISKVLVKPAVTYGAVTPIDLGDLDGAYARMRIESAAAYLTAANLSIQGQCGRDVFFGICCVLIRRMRLSTDVAVEIVEAVYNPRLLAAGTTPWLGDELESRLESARETASEVPPGDIPDERTWNDLTKSGAAS